ncbi:MAG: DUF2911 domain-containing protein [bacterium]
MRVFLRTLARSVTSVVTGVATISATIVALAHPSLVFAQGYPFSQRTTIAQSVALTEISLTYGRPVARGRALWGQLVPWDTVWHPGADSATRLSFNHDIVIEGHPMKAGEYSLWLIPREHKPWTVILSRAAHTFHIPYPGASKDALRFDVAPESLSHMESMAIYFPKVLRDDAIMRIHWGELGVPINIKAPYKPPE